MPKYSKKRAHTPEDDESAEEQTLKPSKKAKGDKSGKTTDAEGPFWELSNKRRVNVTKFNKALLINIREYYDAGGELKPGKKGISLSVDQYKEFLKAIPAINEQLRKEGHILDGDSQSALEESEIPEKTKKSSKKESSSRKANIEATSDEESS
ncbi:transcriptional Coactivator p15-domain-containing protein [Coniochaeta sp. 2T2.1]|nr:transcriptional Coactivator p15-domain-containing protein [Coniochaeta sp. 2T2.1]